MKARSFALEDLRKKENKAYPGMAKARGQVLRAKTITESELDALGGTELYWIMVDPMEAALESLERALRWINEVMYLRLVAQSSAREEEEPENVHELASVQ